MVSFLCKMIVERKSPEDINVDGGLYFEDEQGK
mgnify:CR=1 FL=1